MSDIENSRNVLICEQYRSLLCGEEMKKIIKGVIFILIFVCIFNCVTSILKAPIGTAWANQTGMQEVHKYKDEYDALFCGTSMAIANISNQYLYEEYGIASVSIAEPEQPLYLTLYTLEDALRVQKPVAVVLDSKALFYTEKDTKEKAENRTDYILHNV